jgi:pimeloyl-ACP methyl ester carboxylesterase
MLADSAAVDSTTQYYRDMVRGPAFQEDTKLAAAPITVPSLVLAGARDGCFRLEEYEPQSKHFTGGYTFESIEGGGHFLHRELPEAVLAGLLEFLAAH